MNSSGPTKREIDAELKTFHNPAPMTIEQALASDNPAFEIARRLGLSQKQPMTDAEQLFYEASYFLGDVLNGGFDQCLINSAGDYFLKVVRFADEYCNPDVAVVLRKVAREFPNAAIPEERSERFELLESLTSGNENLFDLLDSEFYGLEEQYLEGLLNLACSRKSEFVNLDWAAGDA